MKVRDVMQRAVPTIRENETLDGARQLMVSANVRHLPVLRAEGDALAGMLSERDVLRAAASGATYASTFARSVRDFMVTPVEYVHPDTELAVALARMVERRIGCLPVLDGPRIAGVITAADLVRHTLPSPEAASARVARPGETPISAIMHADPLTAHENDTLVETAASMARASVRHVCVVDKEGCVIGMISDRDVRRVLGDPRLALVPAHVPEHLRRLTVGHIMTLKPRCIRRDAPVSWALPLFVTQHRVGALPVVDAQGRLCGILSYIDVLKQLAADLESSSSSQA